MAKLPLVLSCALVTVSLIGFADLFKYSFADEFLSSFLISKGATTGQLVLAYGIEGMATTAGVLLVSPGCTDHQQGRQGHSFNCT